MLIPRQYNQSSSRVKNYSSLIFDYCGYTFGGMRYGQRLRAAREHAKLSQEQLSEKIGRVCSQENISKLERGLATGSEYTVHFATACEVNPVWLATGAGEMMNWYYVSDQKLGKAMRLMQEMPSYAVDHVLKEITDTKELLNRDRAEKGGSNPASNSA